MIPLYGLAASCMGVAATPGILLLQATFGWTENLGPVLRAAVLGPAVAASYFAYGFSLLLVLPAVNFALRLKLKAWRGPYLSLQILPWFVHNGLTYIARYTFLELVTPTPFSIGFYKLMGMKIGRGVELNTTHISDPSMITIGDKVTIGGSAALVAHYAAGGYFVLSPIVIEAGATIGLRAIIMGGVQIGKGAKILPNSFVMPKTRVPAGETWGGIPARKLEREQLVTIQSRDDEAA